MQYQAYIQSLSNFNWDFFIRLPCKLILVLDSSLNFVINVIKLLYNMTKISTTLFAIYYSHYKKKPGMSKSANNFFHFWTFPKLLSLPNILSNSIIKFDTYHPHHKDIFVSNPNRTFICIASCLYFGYWLGSLGNLSTTSLFAYNGKVFIAKLGLITK